MEQITPLSPPIPIMVLDLFPEVLTHLVDLLRDLDVIGWSKPTACTGWTVKDVALHLLGDEVSNLSRRRDLHSTKSSISNWQELVEVVNKSNQEWVSITRRLSTRVLIDWLEIAGNQLIDYFKTVDPYKMGPPVSWAGPDRAPVWLNLAREYTERWHHQQHIRKAVGKPGLTEQKYLAPVLATFVFALPVALKSIHRAENTAVVLRISGKSGGIWTTRQEKGTWILHQGGIGKYSARVSIPDEIAWQLFTRGMKPTDAQKHMTVQGDQELGKKILDMVSILA